MTRPETVSAPLTITLFGPMQVLVQGRPLPRLRSRKALWLLALLTLRHDRLVEREWLAGTLWPDIDQSQAFANLRPIVSELRRAFGEEAERLQSPNRHTLLLDLTNAEVDVRIFDAALESRNLSALEQAVALYRGPLLEGCTEEWVGQERDSRERGCLQALQKLADAALASGNYDNAIRYYRQAVSLDSLWDVARRGLMDALAKSGDTNAALQVYREFVERLRSDPKAIPDEKTTALYTRLRAEVRQRANTPVVAAEEDTPVREVAGYLPHPLTELVGREDERAEVAAKLRRSRLVTLTGLGGIGKTRLAIEVAREVITEYPDGVWLISLESLAEDKQVVGQIAAVLGLKEEASGHPLLQSLVSHLARKKLLLVLDNCEHLLQASAEVVQSLLRECSGLRILATSREALRITGETAWAVPSLAVPDPTHLPKGRTTVQRVLVGYEGVQLFLDRAQAVQKTFCLTANNALTVAQICYQLEGIPLALEFAAARVKAMSVEQIATRLYAHLGSLTGASRLALSRQQTLRATLDWSYQLLGERERLLLQRLAVFAGGWTLEAAEDICAGEGIESEQVPDILTALVDKSLVVFDETEGRYRFLEMVRQYASERLRASNERERIRNRHRDWYLALIENAQKALEASLPALEREPDNFRAALAWCAEDTDGAEIGLHLAGTLSSFWDLRAHFSEACHYLEQALAREGVPEVSEVRAKAMHRLGTMYSALGRTVASRAIKEESLRLRRQLGKKRDIAFSLISVGHDDLSAGDCASSLAKYEEALGYFREEEYAPGIAWALNCMGVVQQIMNEYKMAREMYQESLRLRREHGNKHGIAHTLGGLGSVLIDEGEYAQAQLVLEESLILRRELKDRFGQGSVLNGLGRVAQGIGDYDTAQALYHEGLEIFRELGQKQGMGRILNNLATLAYLQRNYTLAFALYRDSLAISIEVDHPKDIAEDLEGFAVVLLANSRDEIAVRVWGAAHALRERIGAFLPPRERAEYEREFDRARVTLGTEGFAAAWEAGLALTWEQAVTYTRGE